MSSGPANDAGEVRREAQEAINRARKEVEEGRQASAESQAQDGDLVAGSVEVVAASPVTAALRAKLEESLQEMAGLRLVTSGGSADGGIRMMVFASQPVPLAAALGRLPFVAQVTTQQLKKVTQLQVKLAVPA